MFLQMHIKTLALALSLIQPTPEVGHALGEELLRKSTQPALELRVASVASGTSAAPVIRASDAQATTGTRENLERQIEDAVRIATNLPSLNSYLRLAELYHKKGDLEKFGIYAKKAVEFPDPTSYAHNYLGIYYLLIGNTPLAKAQFLKSIELDHNNAAAMSNLAQAFLNEGGYKQAEHYAGLAIKIKGDMFEPHFIKARTLYYQGIFEAAEDAVQKANQLNPNNPLIRNLMDTLNLLKQPQTPKN